MKILICAVILSLFVGCNVNHKTDIKLVKGKAVIEGKVQYFTDSSMVLRFSNFSVVTNIEQVAILDSSGNFKTELELFNPQEVVLSYENSLATLYLHPGDTLYLSIDANLFQKDDHPYYEVNGKNSTTSQNIRDYLKFHTPFTYDQNYKPKYDKPFNEFLSNIKMHLTIEDSVLQEFHKQNKPTDEFMRWAKDDVLYSSFSFFMNYFAINDKKHKEYRTEIFNTGLFPNDDSAIINSNYIWFLSQYPFMKYYAADSVAMELFKKDIKNSFTRTFDNLIKNEKPGLSRDIMIYKMFDMFDGRHGVPTENSTALCEKYKTYINNHELNSKLEEKVSNFNRQENKKNVFVDLKLKAKSETIAKFWETLETKYKNKAIYIDIWATWCAPCRGELPHLVDLSNYYKDKPVAIVTICLASNKDEWEKAISKISNVSDNYFFSKDDSDLLGDELKVNGFPTHLIINRKGELIDKNISNISSVKETLTKLLEE